MDTRATDPRRSRQIRCEPERADAWDGAAARAGLSFSEWARRVLDAAVEAQCETCGGASPMKARRR